MGDVFGFGKAVEKLADPVVDLIKRVAGPAADEIGLTVQDKVRVYRAKHAYRLLEKFQKFVGERGINPRQINLKLLLPAIDFASVEDDEDLHTMWANLLTNAADPTQDEPLPSFAHTLKQLSKSEATFLNAFYDRTIEWQKSAGQQQEPYAVSVDEIASVLSPTAQPSISANEFRLVVDDLQRLGLLRMDTKVFVGGRGADRIFYGKVPAFLQHAYFVTDYAMNFVKACR